MKEELKEQIWKFSCQLQDIHDITTKQIEKKRSNKYMYNTL